MNILNLSNWKVAVEDKEILHGIDLKINPGEIHMIMGPNGSGKSTLASSLMGHPSYSVLEGSKAEFMGEDLLSMSVDERARKGLFLSFQYPEEVPGITNEYFLQKAKSLREGQGISLGFKRQILKEMKELNLDEKYLERHLNVGFSGGEKKKNEILQMAVLEPKLAILDETDSGLDVDAIKVVYEEIQKKASKDNAILIITHYSRILKYVKPDFIHLLVKGNIVKSGGIELADLVDEKGYDEFLK